MARYVRWFALAAVGALAVLLAPGSVSAHADYDYSVPDHDEVVAESPAQLDVYFTQELFREEGRNFVRVFDDGGTQVSDGDGLIDDDDRTHMFTTLQPDLPAGRYIVQWMSLSFDDGDDESGAFCFFVAVEPSATEAEECAAFLGEEDGTPQPTAAAPTEPAGVPTEPAALASPVPTTDDGVVVDDDDSNMGALVIGIIVAIAVVVAVGGGALLWMRRS